MMRKNFTVNLCIYVLSVVILSCWYIVLHRFEELINAKSITKVVVNVGIVGAVVPAAIFSLIYYLTKRVNNKILPTLLIFILVIILIFSVYWITVNMVFYHVDDSKSFLQSLMEVF